MRIALYNENAVERQEMERQLRVCGREALRRVDVTAFDDHQGFCQAVRDGPERFDLLVVAQDGTHSLETLDYLQAHGVSERTAWFSDLDFGVRSYAYQVLWFARKPISLSTMKKVFDRAAGYRAHATGPGKQWTVTSSNGGERSMRKGRAPFSIPQGDGEKPLFVSEEEVL